MMGKGKRNPPAPKRPAWSWFVFRFWLLSTILFGGVAVLFLATGSGDSLISYWSVPWRAGIGYLWLVAGVGSGLSSFLGYRLWTYGAPTVLCLMALLMQVSATGPVFPGDASLLFLLNLVAYSAFFFLFSRVLDRYGFGDHLSVFAVFAFLLLNRPFAAAMAQPSFDLHALNLCLIGYLLFNAGHRNSSAAVFACAVPLQPLTAVFAALFLCMKDFRRVGVYAGTLALVAVASCAVFGVDPVAASVARWAAGWDGQKLLWLSRPGDADGSVTFYVWSAGWIVRGCALAALFFAERRMVKCLMWKNRKDAAGVFHNLYPFLFAVPLLAPPFGEARLIFAALPMVMLLKKLQKTGTVFLYLACWLVLFVLPLDLMMNTETVQAARTGGCFALLVFAVCMTWSRIRTATPFGTFKTRLDLVMGKGRIEY